MKYLVIRFSSLGDIILTAPVIESLAALPGTTIHYAVFGRFAPIISYFPAPVIVHPFAGRTREELLTYAKELSEEPFDIVFDLHANWRSRILVNQLAAPVAYTYPKDFWRRWRMVWLKQGFTASRHVVDRYLITLREAQVPIVTEIPRLRSAKSVENLAAKRIAAGRAPSSARRDGRNEKPNKKSSAFSVPAEAGTSEADQPCLPSGVGERPLIGIGWGARWPAKKVPPTLWKNLFAELAPLISPTYVLFAGQGETGEVAEFIAANERHPIISYCGMDLDMVMGTLSRCSAFVTSDSGLMHAAAALDVPTWGLFGPTHPALGFAPRGAAARAVHARVFCSPCSRHGRLACYRRRRYCFEKIDISLIAREIAGRLAEVPAQDK